MKVSQLVDILKGMPQDIEVEINDNNGGEVYAIEGVDHYVPNLDLWPDDIQAVIIQVNES